MSLFLLCCLLLLPLGQSAYAEPVKVNLTADERNRLDTFFSNFAEKSFKPFSSGTISDADLTHFGLNYLVHNKHKSKLFVKISVQELDKVTTFYFNKVPKKHSAIYGWILNHGIYYKITLNEEMPSLAQIDELWDNLNADNGISREIIFAAEELPSFSQINELWGNGKLDNGISQKIILAANEQPSFSQIDELWDNGNGTLTAIISVFRQVDGWKGDPHGVLEKWAKDDPQHCPRLKGNYRAIISLDYSGDSERYILHEYLVNEPPVGLKNQGEDLSQ